MPALTHSPERPKAGGLLSAVLELILTFGGYYLLRAFGVSVFWSLTVPAIAVAAVTVAVTVRRRKVDLIGLLVLMELAATIVVSLVTRSPRIAAVREPIYILIGGVFCLVTLLGRVPFTHTSTASFATFGDPKRKRAFAMAWSDVPRYRMWQRLLTACFGAIMVVFAIIRIVLLWSAPEARIAHAVNVSNTLSFVMIGALLVVSGVLIQPPKKIIERLVQQMNDVPAESSRTSPVPR
ncbi:VC0807 family protein [Actinoplanes sp. NPDC051411]|uniref:VC0807 family protein n=1 Tax=Actinoplanes sp. NPDC051411 TaxID=3155522 RepID=UPI003413C1F4